MQERRESAPFIPIKLAEGKTKIIWSMQDPVLVRIENKDDITAGDGARRDTISGKARIATETTSNVFRLLNSRGINTHFVRQDSEVSFIAKSARMLPLECVARRRAAGSFLKRNPHISEGERFETIPVEFYLKDDTRHDPLVEFDSERGIGLLFDAKDPVLSRKPIGQVALQELGITFDDVKVLQDQTRKTFEIVEDALRVHGVDLVDMKIEFGKDKDENLMLGDVVDNDSWRIWPGGDKSRMLDKQKYRDGGSLDAVLKDYEQVAALTRTFAR